MEKNLILGFIGKNSKGVHRLSNEAIAQLIRENYPLGYVTVLTGIDGSFEMSCANTALQLRSDGLDIKLTVAVTQRKFEAFTRYVRDGRPLNDGQLIISQADDLQIIAGGSSLAADILRDKYIIDSSDLLYFYAPAGCESYRGKYISYFLLPLAASAQEQLQPLGKECAGFRGPGSQPALYPAPRPCNHVERHR